MSETGISRRNMLAVAGAGLVVAACDGKPEGEAKSSGPIKYTGRPGPFGFEPHSADDEKLVSSALGKFSPSYVTVVQVFSDGAWAFSANHAAIVAEPDNTEAQALRILRKADRPAPPGFRRKFRDFGPGSAAMDKEQFYRRAQHPPTGSYDLDDFQSFGFASQHEIFVYFASRRATLQPDNLISFFPMLNDGTAADPNDSFFAREIQNPAGLNGTLIAIRNYFAKAEWNEDGTVKSIVRRNPASDKATHALNLHFTLPAARPGLPPMPMIIDPTTGNGMGSEP
jgi:hypothetical protein